MTNFEREEQLDTFINEAGWSHGTRIHLKADASFRSYVRINDGSNSVMVMNAPPPKEDVRPFLKIGQHLLDLGFRTPKILSQDIPQGFLLLEDFGDDTFTTLLVAGHCETALYEIGIDLLIKLHRLKKAAVIDIPFYDQKTILREVDLLIDWYVPEVIGSTVDDLMRQEYHDAWNDVFSSLPPMKNTIVLRDFHVDNLMMIPDDSDEGQLKDCGLLDFQDALIGSAAYDVVSFLEDARRDISLELREKMLNRYFQALPDVNRSDFMMWYAAFGAQRHAKVLGIFMRLMRRDSKPVYMPHIPRVKKMLDDHLGTDLLMPVARWFEKHYPEY